MEGKGESTTDANDSAGVAASLSEEDDKTCPICLHDDKELVQGKCQHCFCLECVERHLLSPTTSQSNEQRNSESSVVTPTLGLCPICRAELYLFDLKNVQTDQLVYEKNHDIAASPLAGAIYAQIGQNGGIGYGSFHFASADSEEPQVPYFNIEHLPRIPGHPAQVLFVDAHFHQPTRTFAGTLLFAVGVFERWNIYLSFSADWRFISRGVIIKRRRPKRSDDLRSTYPFDGTWSVLTTRSVRGDASTLEETISVVGSTYYDLAGRYYMVKWEPDEESSSPMAGVATIVDGTNGLPVWKAQLEKHCDVGDKIQWNFLPTLRDLPIQAICWTRETVSATLPPDEVNPIGGASGRIYQIQNAAQLQPREAPIYHRDTLWGNTFCQAFKIGLASYHFVSPEQVYISYEHPATGQWAPLDNGTPIPSRVLFHNIQLNDHTFTGEIHWHDDYGTSWQGTTRWEYEMTFDSEYTCIASGQVKVVSVNHPDYAQEFSKYGEDLVYVNAALWEVFTRDAPSEGEDQMEHYRHQSEPLRRRLQQERVPVRTLAMIHSILTLAQQPGAENPIDYNL